MQSILAKIQAKPGSEAAVEKILRNLAAATAKEAGAVVYEILRDAEQRETFVVYERYADEHAKQAHLASEHLTLALRELKSLVATAPEIRPLDFAFGARATHELFDGKKVEVRILPLGAVSLVYARGDKGILACGAIDPQALSRFGLPAARVRPPEGKPSVASFEDLLAGEVREANTQAVALGIVIGMAGRQALRLL